MDKTKLIAMAIALALVLLASSATIADVGLIGYLTGNGFQGFGQSGSGGSSSVGSGPGAGPGEGAGVCTWDVISKDPPGANIVTVVVPVWKPSGGLGTLHLRVHRNCAEAIHVLFQQIYDSADKPIIQSSDTGCYSSRARSASRHNWGVACDINWDENFCHNCYGGSGNVGKFWKPGNISPDNTYNGWSPGFSPLSIPINSTVANAFFGQRWGRGLYHSFNDFMHFSVDGH